MGQSNGMTSGSAGNEGRSQPTPQPPAPENRGCTNKKAITCLVIGFAVGSTLVIVLIIVAIAVPAVINARRHAWESGAQQTLRSIGEIQSLYHEHNNSGNYGSFRDCKDLELIPDGYTFSNMAKNYTLTWEVTPRELAEDGETYIGRSTYTVIAYPLETHAGYLSTFAIREDQVVRIYEPDVGNIEIDVLTWESMGHPPAESDKESPESD